MNPKYIINIVLMCFKPCDLVPKKTKVWSGNEHALKLAPKFSVTGPRQDRRPSENFFYSMSLSLYSTYKPYHIKDYKLITLRYY